MNFEGKERKVCGGLPVNREGKERKQESGLDKGLKREVAEVEAITESKGRDRRGRRRRVLEDKA